MIVIYNHDDTHMGQRKMPAWFYTFYTHYQQSKTLQGRYQYFFFFFFAILKQKLRTATGLIKVTQLVIDLSQDSELDVNSSKNQS